MNPVLHYESAKAYEAQLIRLADRERVGAPKARGGRRLRVSLFDAFRKPAPVIYLRRSTS